MSDESEPVGEAHRRVADLISFIVYGTIAVLASVGGLALEADALHALESAAVLIVVAVSAWLAHSMWRVVGARARREPEPERSHELHELLRSWPILASGVPAATVMMLTAAGLWSVAAGLRVAQGLGIVVLLVAGVLTGRLAGASPTQQAAYMFALPFVGLAIVGLEVAAHRV